MARGLEARASTVIGQPADGCGASLIIEFTLWSALRPKSCPQVLSISESAELSRRTFCTLRARLSSLRGRLQHAGNCASEVECRQRTIDDPQKYLVEKQSKK